MTARGSLRVSCLIPWRKSREVKYTPQEFRDHHRLLDVRHELADPFDQAESARRYLLALPSFLHRRATHRRHRRPGRSVYEALADQPGPAGRGGTPPRRAQPAAAKEAQPAQGDLRRRGVSLLVVE